MNKNITKEDIIGFKKIINILNSNNRNKSLDEFGIVGLGIDLSVCRFLEGGAGHELIEDYEMEILLKSLESDLLFKGTAEEFLK